jgi:hypothetical protein
MISSEIKFLVSVSLPTMCVSLRNDGLMQIRVEAGTCSTVPMVKEAHETIGKVGKGQRYPLLIIAEKDSTLDTAAMAYMAKDDSNPYSNAEAIVIYSISQKLLGNFYLSFNRPKKPTKVFTKMEEALQWLEQFKVS